MYSFFKNYVTLEGIFSHNVLYYQELSVSRLQERFYANIYFELIQNMYSAFKQ